MKRALLVALAFLLVAVPRMADACNRAALASTAYTAAPAPVAVSMPSTVAAPPIMPKAEDAPAVTPPKPEEKPITPPLEEKPAAEKPGGVTLTAAQVVTSDQLAATAEETLPGEGVMPSAPARSRSSGLSVAAGAAMPRPSPVDTTLTTGNLPLSGSAQATPVMTQVPVRMVFRSGGCH